MEFYCSPEIEQVNLEYFMRAALEEAESAGQAGELPIGAVVVIDGVIIARGRARHNQTQSQVSHAEMNAIQSGGLPLWRDFRRAILFTTVEPCPMCLGAAVMADIPHIIFALPDRIVYSGLTLEHNPYVRRHIRSYQGGILESDSIRIFEQYNPRSLYYIQNGTGGPG